MPEMIALKRIRVGGHSKESGERFSIDDKAARVLNILKKAKYCTNQEIAGVSVIEPHGEQELSPRTGKPKRQYRRRDMQAE
jgi:hypothetical protein